MKNRCLIHNNPALKQRRRELRRKSTKAERFLWTCLRKSQLDGKRFRRQHSIGPYMVDFYCPECRVIVELDGAVHLGLMHNVEREIRRTEFLKKLGLEILRFENEQVFKDREGVLETIRAVLKSRA